MKILKQVSLRFLFGIFLSTHLIAFSQQVESKVLFTKPIRMFVGSGNGLFFLLADDFQNDRVMVYTTSKKMFYLIEYSGTVLDSFPLIDDIIPTKIKFVASDHLVYLDQNEKYIYDLSISDKRTSQIPINKPEDWYLRIDPSLYNEIFSACDFKKIVSYSNSKFKYTMDFYSDSLDNLYLGGNGIVYKLSGEDGICLKGIQSNINTYLSNSVSNNSDLLYADFSGKIIITNLKYKCVMEGLSNNKILTLYTDAYPSCNGYSVEKGVLLVIRRNKTGDVSLEKVSIKELINLFNKGMEKSPLNPH